jgi:hypothetical protein
MSYYDVEELEKHEVNFVSLWAEPWIGIHLLITFKSM